MAATRLDDPGPFRVGIFDKAFQPMFPLGDAAVSVTPRHLAIGTGSLSIPLAHNRADAMFAAGVRCTIDYLIGEDRNDDASWLRVMSGQLFSRTIPEASVPAVGKVLTFGIRDDYAILGNLLGWPNPGSAIGSQNVNAYDVRSGNAESVIKGYVTANKGRLPYTVTVATNGNRGATVYGSVRFDKLIDVLPVYALAGGIGLSVKQVAGGLVFDIYVPTDRSSRVLSEASGTLTSWSLSSTGPSATAAIVATDGAATARHFVEFFDTSTETLWHDRVETFVDARDLQNTQTSEVAQRGATALAAGAPQAGWSVTLAETDVVRYGRNLLVGDKVAVQITPTLSLVDVLSECTLSWQAGQGLTVSPVVGAQTAQSSPNRLLARAVSTALRGVRTLRSSL